MRRMSAGVYRSQRSTLSCPAAMAPSIDEEVIFMMAPDGISEWCRLCKNWATQGHLDCQRHKGELVKWRRQMRARTWQDKWYHDMPVQPPSDGPRSSSSSAFSAIAEIMEGFAPFMKKNIESALSDAFECGNRKGYLEGFNDGRIEQKVNPARAMRERSRSRRR